jgi:dTDP-4-dehydrorhamnose 3,5-epimerase
MPMTPKKSAQSVTRGGESVAPRIDGLLVRQQVTQQDHRGTLTEIYSTSWGFDDIPLVHVYAVTTRPGMIKGWAIHYRHVDRYFFYSGSLELVLYDAREKSPTHGMLNELYFSDTNRSLVSVPPGVYHAVHNVGTTDAVMINCPSEPYHHEDPDKYTLPLVNDVIPYRFDKGSDYQH